ncbi:phosphodiesterase [Rhizobium sp. Root1220]|uniref:phosphodiesterase n=1 Tax=Rhizobium sp. Root1220 TaxID=1736432 RepID=UPI000700208A|nr:phosphodiesterase [Rhizobium sp. Root1220]KQV70379.1 metallophosphatase [Rhizobium sp. Root1220]
MKLIHVSDLHLMPPGETLLGLDPLARVNACLADIERFHADAALVVVSGDLSETGTPDTYAALKERLSRFPLQTRLLLGNHDDRANFSAAFPDHVTPDGFAHAAIDLQHGRVIALDTLNDGKVTGRLCPARLAWLAARLEEARGRPVYLFMHHPPAKVHLPALDSIGLADPQPFFDLMTAHGDVRHVFAGHFHRLVTGNRQGIPFTILRSTNHQTALDFVSPQTTNCFEPPLYSIVIAEPDSLVIHFHQFQG